MSKNKTSFGSLSVDELKSKERELRTELFKVRFQKSTGQLTNTSLLKSTRRSLAQVKTAITQKSQAQR
jgi:large subunit ribosomal protein L29